MKILKYLIIGCLIIFNISVLNLVISNIANNKAVNETLATIDDSVVYINSGTTGYPNSNSFISRSSDYPDAKSNFEKIEQIKKLDTVQSVEFVDIPYSNIISVKSEIKNHISRDILQMNLQNLSAEQFKQLELVAGQVPTAKNQVIISSAVVEHYQFTPDQVLGTTHNNYQIVGVYHDSQDYTTYKNKHSKVIANYAYSLTSDKERYTTTFSTDDGVEHPVQYIKITFNNDNTEANVKTLEDQLVIRDSITNLSDARVEVLDSINVMIYGLLISAILIDLITIFITIDHKKRLS